MAREPLEGPVLRARARGLLVCGDGKGRAADFQARAVSDLEDLSLTLSELQLLHVWQ